MKSAVPSNDAAAQYVEPPVGGGAELLGGARVLAPSAAGATDIGQRDHNEDHVLLRPELGLYLLADGAGGHNAGNVASALATTTVANVFETSAASLSHRPEVDRFGISTLARRLTAAIHRANLEVVEIAKKAERYQGMGTTLVALAFSPDGDMVHIAHVGDSRCYRLRGGLVELLTVDHCLATDVLEMHPDVDDRLVARMPRHVVTRALGMEATLRVSVRSLRAVGGDVYLMCSDGLTDVLDEGAIEESLRERRSPEEHVRALIDGALAAGARDNIGAVVIVCEETDVAPTRRPSVGPSEAADEVRAPAGSAPEIIIVGVETRVVPAESASASLLDALGHFARLRRAASGEPKEKAAPEPCASDGGPESGPEKA